MPSLVTKTELVSFLNFAKTNSTVTIVEADINDFIYNSTWNTLEREVGNSWDANSRTLLLNGSGNNVIFLPYTPIITLTEVKVIARDLTETIYVLSGSDRTIWYDKEVGKVEIIKTADYSTDPVVWITTNTTKFPEGLENVSVTGIFVGTAPEDAKYLQML